MSPMLWGDLVTDHPWLPHELKRRWRWGFLCGFSAATVFVNLLWWFNS